MLPSSISASAPWRITEGDFSGAVGKAARASSMQANPLAFTGEELLQVATAAW
jgi:hypothetical protein